MCEASFHALSIAAHKVVDLMKPEILVHQKRTTISQQPTLTGATAIGAELTIGEARIALRKTASEENKKVEREGIEFCVRS